MSKAFVKELDELVKANIITAEKAQEISAYYSAQNNSKPNRFPVVVNILGALLASLGIILLLAHNWDELGRLTKTIIGFIPLLIGQVLCGYTLLKRKESVAWRETSAVVLFFAVASCISIIGQTYHLNGTLTGFLLTWMLLTVPLVYIMPSAVTALLYIGGITWYACALGYGSFYHREIPFYYIGLLLLVLPFYMLQYLHKPQRNAFTLLSWMLILSVSIVLGCFYSNEQDNEMWIFAGYLALFCVFYIIGRLAIFEHNRLFANPFLVIGILGILAILFCWSFEWLWSYRDKYLYNERSDNTYSFYASTFYYITVVLLVLATLLIAANVKRLKKGIIDPAGFSGFLLFILLLFFRGAPQFCILLINLWILFVAIFFIRKGALQDHLGILNFGLVIIALLACFRFFDDQIPFVWRGLFFLATGAGFFVANYMIVKKRKALSKGGQ